MKKEISRAKKADRFRPTKKEIMVNAKRLRVKTVHFHLTDDELAEWENKGRP